MQHLIVVIPGIAGSMLADDDGIVWGDSARRMVGLVRDPSRLSVEEAPSLRVVGVMPTLGYCPPFQLTGYDRLINRLVNGLGSPTPVVDVAVDGAERNLAADIVVLPYDFRLGVAAATERLSAEVHARLGHLTEPERAKRVIVIGHSMGGLVGRLWLTDPVQARTCLALLTVGTPHRGATKALDWMVNGASFGGGLRLASEPVVATSRRLLGGLTDVLRGWPGMYDLLPTYRVINDTDHDRQMTPLDLGDPSGPGFAADPTFRAETERASRMHRHITDTWGAPTEQRLPPTVPFFARDHGTPHQATLAAGSLTATGVDPHWQPKAGWGGDGTVPALSAIPPELGAPESSIRRHHVLGRHAPMVGTDGVVQMVRNLIGEDMSAVRGAVAAPGVRLGLDLDDACLLGDTVVLSVRMLTEDGFDPGRAAVYLTAEPAGRSAAPVTCRAEWDAAAWTIEFKPPAAGLWRLSVQATRADGDEPPIVSDALAVIDPSEPDRTQSDHASSTPS
ncbi:MAG: lipase/acyltransferase domain-containing protein [Nocardioides sp.]